MDKKNITLEVPKQQQACSTYDSVQTVCAGDFVSSS